MNTLASIPDDVQSETRFPASTRTLLTLREHLIIDHPVNLRLKTSAVDLFEFFELYAHFVYDFAAYVSALFANLADPDAKAHIYDNLLDEIGHQPDAQARYEQHHGELYRHFLASLRRTKIYRAAIDEERTRELQQLSRGISQRFYEGHRDVLRAGNDRVTIAAFSSIEGWVSREYAMWRDLLREIGDDLRFVDMRTIDLHCECDVEHSRILDDIIGRFVGGDDEPSAVHAVNSGLLRGIALSVSLFDDIERSLRAPRQLG